MTICEGCAGSFPDDLVRTMETGTFMGDVTRRQLCGVCALEAARAIHGDPKLEFHGPKARDIYERTKALIDQRQSKPHV